MITSRGDALEIDSTRAVRHAIEVRNKSFATAPFVALLRRYSVALVIADSPGTWPYAEDITADFAYIRMHGKKKAYADGYTDAAIDRFAERIRAWAAGGEPADAVRIGAPAPGNVPSRDIYCYFDNDAKAHAPLDAIRMMAKLGIARDMAFEVKRRGRT